MDGLIFNCKAQELNLTDLFMCGVSLYQIAEKKLDCDFNSSQEIIDKYIDLVTAGGERYMLDLQNSRDKSAADELKTLTDCKKIMDIKYWRNLSHLLYLCKDNVKK